MNPRASFAFAMAVSTGCAYHHSVATLSPATTSEEATVQLRNGERVEVEAQDTPGGARWFAHGATPDAPSGIVSSASIRSYTTYNHGRGALEGAVLGTLAGAAVGAAIGYADGNDCPPRCFISFTAGAKAAIGGILLGGVGLVTGGVVGYVAGSRDVYEVDGGVAPRVSVSIVPGRGDAGLSWSF